MIKFLTDENISPQVVAALRAEGYDVKDVKEERLFGISDGEIVGLGRREERVIITCDKDFSNLIKFPLLSHYGVILLRFSNLSPINIIASFIPLLGTILSRDIIGALVIVKDGYIEIMERG